ncbi:aminoglycoside phosphotransferase family protein [Klebsiella pneumoniae]|uniref:aminoglycoside phosphotransferase family protein n=1 Tax=Klebsiella pneumoniae TaxID=573 RepID=UPI003AB95E50
MKLRGADYLVWRNGRGAVRLLGRENNLMLLRIWPGSECSLTSLPSTATTRRPKLQRKLMAKLYAAI